MDQPSTGEVWRRSMTIYGHEMACWPGCPPTEVIRQAVLSYQGLSPSGVQLSELDYLATVAPLLALLATSPDGKSDQWPSRTPVEFAVGLKMVRNIFHAFIDRAREAIS